MAEGGAEALQQGCERPHLIASIVKKQREIYSDARLNLSILFSPGPEPTFRVLFPP